MSASSLSIAIQKAINTQVVTDILKRGGRVAGAVAIDLQRKRSLARINNRGRKFPNDSKSYAKFKAKAIRGKAKLRNRRTPFAAKSVKDGMALSGRTLADMYVKSAKTKVTTGTATSEIIIDFRSQRSRDIVEWQSKQGRDIRGLAPENTAQGKRERAEIARAYKGATQIPRNKKLNIDSKVL